mgnify:CR=1 FL=1
MKEIINPISKKFVEDKISELVNLNLPVISLKNIDDFLKNELDAINENLVENLNHGKDEIYEKIEKYITTSQATINELNSKNQNYEQYLNTIGHREDFKKIYKEKPKFKHF